MAEARDLAERLAEVLRGRRETLAVAESCTGGLLAAYLTEVPGSSEYLWGGAVVYSAAAKQRILGLDAAFVEQHGTVSSETTEALASAAREVSGSTYGAAITGWAGPTGGDELDPVGTVYVALAKPNGVETRRYRFGGERSEVRREAVVSAIGWLLEVILELSHSEPETGC
jgi:PncC family amidohydrolase